MKACLLVFSIYSITLSSVSVHAQDFSGSMSSGGQKGVEAGGVSPRDFARPLPGAHETDKDVEMWRAYKTIVDGLAGDETRRGEYVSANSGLDTQEKQIREKAKSVASDFIRSAAFRNDHSLSEVVKNNIKKMNQCGDEGCRDIYRDAVSKGLEESWGARVKEAVDSKATDASERVRKITDAKDVLEKVLKESASERPAYVNESTTGSHSSSSSKGHR